MPGRIGVAAQNATRFLGQRPASPDRSWAWHGAGSRFDCLNVLQRFSRIRYAAATVSRRRAADSLTYVSGDRWCYPRPAVFYCAPGGYRIGTTRKAAGTPAIAVAADTPHAGAARCVRLSATRLRARTACSLLVDSHTIISFIVSLSGMRHASSLN